MSICKPFSPLRGAHVGVLLTANTTSTVTVPAGCFRALISNPDNGTPIFMDLVTVAPPKALCINPSAMVELAVTPGSVLAFQSPGTPTFYIAFGN